MKARNRYGILAGFILAFIVLTPLIVLYVTGTDYDFKTHRFLKTGVIYAKTDPRGATVTINGKVQKAKTPINLKFVLPGDYSIDISKPGYFPWDKRLNVQAGIVTYANKDLPNVVLFKSDPQKNQISDQILAAALGKNRALYLNSTTLFLSNTDDLQTKQQLTLPVNLQSAKIISSKDENYFLIYGQTQNDGQTATLYAAVFDAGKNQLFDITNELSPNPDSSNFLLTSDALYELNNSSLSTISWRSQNSKQALFTNVNGFTLAQNALYIYSGQQVIRADLPNYNQTVLASNLPSLNKIQFFISAQNQIFILGDNNLYSLGSGLNLIAPFVRSAEIYDQDRKMIFATGNEIDSYDLNNGQISLLTRTSSQLKDPQAFFALGWAFFIGNGRLQNIEIDSRDHQNNYTFTKVSEDSSFSLSSNAKKIALFDDGKIYEMTVR